MDTIINAIYDYIRGLPNSTFCIIMGVLAGLEFLFMSIFLKANKKDSTKVAKISSLLWTILCLVVFVVLINIRS